METIEIQNNNPDVCEKSTSLFKKIWFRTIYSQQGFALYLLLTDFKNWDYDRFTIKHKSGITIWVGNGACFFDGYPSMGTPNFLGILERHFLYAHFKRMYARRIIWEANGAL